RLSLSSSLFPYTTLFRSVLLLLDVWRGGDRDRGHVVGAAQPVRLRPDRHPRKRRGRGGSRRQHDGVQGWGVRARRRNLVRRRVEDRKSTRLNSSHLGISY